MSDFLDLPDWAQTARRLDAGTWIVDAEYSVQPEACQKCGAIGNLYKHGTKVTTYRDIPTRGSKALLVATVRRYKCRDCGGTFLQPLGGVHPERLMTTRCAEHIEQQCLRKQFLELATEIGCDDKTVRSMAWEYIERLNAAYSPALPAWLGIDETQIDGHLRLVLTDIQHRKKVDMLVDDSNSGLATWLNRYKDTGHVEVVTTDMHKAYRNVVRALLPGVPVVVDKFQVVRMANTALDEVRNRVAKENPAPVGREWKRQKGLLRMRYKKLDEKGRFNLQMWLDNEPEIGTAYRLKEAFYDIYDAPTKEEARRLLAEWRASIPAEMRKTSKKEFRPLWTATKNWTEDILSYWDFPVTNAYTEAVNGVAKVINRDGRGYSFEVLRARWLFKDEAAELLDPDDDLAMSKATPHDQLLAMLGNRCESCLGLFPGNQLHTAVDHFRPKAGGRTYKNFKYVCWTCNARFHTGVDVPHVLTTPLVPHGNP